MRDRATLRYTTFGSGTDTGTHGKIRIARRPINRGIFHSPKQTDPSLRVGRRSAVGAGVLASVASEPNMDMTIVRAQGAVLALVGTLLEREGIVPLGEFSRLLGLLAIITAETDKAQGDVLALWAALASDAPRPM
jgi:hypothetical protein